MDPYEDPRIPIEERIDDLLSQMTLEEEAGMLFINGAAVNADGSIEDNPDQPGFAIGTGIGGGLVINGQLHLGIGGTGGELGHTVIDFNGPRCGCENYGCLEAYASAPAISAIGPRRIIIAGGVSQVGELLLEPIRRTLRERVTVMPIDQVEVVRSQLGNNAGVIGVARWAAEML